MDTRWPLTDRQIDKQTHGQNSFSLLVMCLLRKPIVKQYIFMREIIDFIFYDRCYSRYYNYKIIYYELTVPPTRYHAIFRQFHITPDITLR